MDVTRSDTAALLGRLDEGIALHLHQAGQQLQELPLPAYRLCACTQATFLDFFGCRIMNWQCCNDCTCRCVINAAAQF